MGWNFTTVGDVFLVTMGQSPPGHTYNVVGEGEPFYQGRTDFGFRFPKRRVYCTAPTRHAMPGETLLSVRAPVGDINIANENCAIGRGVASVRHKSGRLSYTYYAFGALREALDKYNGEGTVFGSISKDALLNIPVLEPSAPTSSVFNNICSALDGRINSCENEMVVLVALRDLLLPKLISGELRVTEAERIIEKSA